MFVESVHFMITNVTIYRIMLERSSMQGTSCDWVCIVGVIFSLTISHGLVVLVSFLLCIGNRIVIEFTKIVKSIKVWTNEIFFHGIFGWCLNGQAICLSIIHLLVVCFDECFLSILLRLILLYWNSSMWELGIDVNLWIESFRIVSIQ